MLGQRCRHLPVATGIEPVLGNRQCQAKREKIEAEEITEAGILLRMESAFFAVILSASYRQPAAIAAYYKSKLYRIGCSLC